MVSGKIINLKVVFRNSKLRYLDIDNGVTTMHCTMLENRKPENWQALLTKVTSIINIRYLVA